MLLPRLPIADEWIGPFGRRRSFHRLCFCRRQAADEQRIAGGHRLGAALVVNDQVVSAVCRLLLVLLAVEDGGLSDDDVGDFLGFVGLEGEQQRLGARRDD